MRDFGLPGKKMGLVQSRAGCPSLRLAAAVVKKTGTMLLPRAEKHETREAWLLQLGADKQITCSQGTRSAQFAKRWRFMILRISFCKR